MKVNEGDFEWVCYLLFNVCCVIVWCCVVGERFWIGWVNEDLCGDCWNGVDECVFVYGVSVWGGVVD